MDIYNKVIADSLGAVLAGSLAEPPAALLQNYVGGGHWRKLVICFAEKVVWA